jgi:hypothetical protein
MKIGANDITDLKIGATEINEVRLGNVLVWQRNNYLLDLYPSTQGQYYMHKVSSTYNGACIRVRRSSDNTEQDIGFLGDDLDTASLLSFVGVGDGLVTTWYSQSGFFNLTQTSSSMQPSIVLSGVLQTLNGKPCLKFDGVNDFLTGGIVANNTNTNMYATCIGELASNNRSLFAKSRAFGTPERYFIIREATTYSFINEIQQTISNQSTASMFSTGSFFIPAVKMRMKTFLNNSLIATTNTATILTGNNNRFLIGAYGNSIDTGQILHNNGKIQCFGFWSGQDYENDVLQINNNINNYYGIY